MVLNVVSLDTAVAVRQKHVVSAAKLFGFVLDGKATVDGQQKIRLQPLTLQGRPPVYPSREVCQSLWA